MRLRKKVAVPTYFHGQVKVAMDLYSQAEQAALKVAHGDRMEVDTMSLGLWPNRDPVFHG